MFAENLKTLRMRRGISQQRLGEAMGVSAVAVGKWEKGTTSPDLNKLMLLADYFGVTIDQLVRGPVEPANSYESARERVRRSAPGAQAAREGAAHGNNARTEHQPEVWGDNLWFSASDAEHAHEDPGSAEAAVASSLDPVIQGGPDAQRMRALIEQSVARGIARYWEMMGAANPPDQGNPTPAHDAIDESRDACGRHKGEAPSAGQKASRYRFPQPTYARSGMARVGLGGFDQARGTVAAMARSEKALSAEEERNLAELGRRLWPSEPEGEE